MTPPTRYALVPYEATDELWKAVGELRNGCTEDQAEEWGKSDKWESRTNEALGHCAAYIAASPNAGCVTAEMLERAAEGSWEEFRDPAAAYGQAIEMWSEADEATRQRWINRQRRAFRSAGLHVADETQRGEAVDG